MAKVRNRAALERRDLFYSEAIRDVRRPWTEQQHEKRNAPQRTLIKRLELPRADNSIRLHRSSGKTGERFINWSCLRPKKRYLELERDSLRFLGDDEQGLNPTSDCAITHSDLLASKTLRLVTTAGMRRSYSDAFSGSAVAAGASLASFDSEAAAPLSPVGSASDDVQRV